MTTVTGEQAQTSSFHLHQVLIWLFTIEGVVGV
jgi:hypothetical protein